jgi:hypothetical protein
MAVYAIVSDAAAGWSYEMCEKTIAIAGKPTMI